MTTRKLKVYPTGDPQRQGLRPQIKFGGLWLEAAGFEPHQIYTVTLHAKGIITLQTETARLAELQDSYLDHEPLYCEHDHPTPAHPNYPAFGQCPECAYWEQVDHEYDRSRDK